MGLKINGREAKTGDPHGNITVSDEKPFPPITSVESIELPAPTIPLETGSQVIFPNPVDTGNLTPASSPDETPQETKQK